VPRAPAPEPEVATTPELYGAGLFSTGAWDFFMAWSPDQRDVFFCRATDDSSAFEILETRRGARGGWSAPAHPPFAARWSNSDPHVTGDGRRVFFISNRPLPGDTGAAARKTYDIWYADRDAAAWGEARHLDALMNDPDGNEWSPTVAATGNIYFGSNRPAGGRGDQDIWVSRLVRGVYLPPENLGDSINTAGGEIEPWVAPDESYLIFSAIGRADGLGDYDLYISFRRNGVWQRALHLPAPINSEAGDLNPSVSPDGRYLYFSSSRSVFDKVPDKPVDYRELQRRLSSPGNGLGDIYRVEIQSMGVPVPVASPP
jgi:Tol biopolymer transport system component